MTFDLAHALVTAIVIFAVIWGLDQTSTFEKMPKGRKFLVKFAVLFAALLVVNLVWPNAPRN